MATKYKEFEDLVDKDERVEMINGEIIHSFSDKSEHADAQSALATTLKLLFQWGRNGGPGGWWIYTELLLRIDGQGFRPDIAGWRKERLPHPKGRITIRPDWVCEVLSPSNHKFDRVTKTKLYAELEIPHYWILDPRPGNQLLEAFALQADASWKLLGSFFPDDTTARIPPFDTVELDLSDVFTRFEEKEEA